MIKPRSLGFLAIALLSVAGFAVMILTIPFTFFASTRETATNLGTGAMIVCGVFGYWATSIAQSEDR